MVGRPVNFQRGSNKDTSNQGFTENVKSINVYRQTTEAKW